MCLDKRIAYNLEATVQMLMQFCLVTYLIWFYKSRKSVLVSP